MEITAIEWCATGILYPHLGDALVLVAKFLGRASRQVDHSVVRIGPAIIDTDKDCPVVGHVGDIRIGRDRQGRVRRRQRVHVEDFAVGGFAAMKISAVPGAEPHSIIIGIFSGRVPALPNFIGRADFVTAATLGNAVTIRVEPCACRRAGFRVDAIFRYRPRIGARP